MQTSIQTHTPGTSTAGSFPFQRATSIQLPSALPPQAGLRYGSLSSAAQPTPEELVESSPKPSLHTHVSQRFGLRLRELRRQRNLTQVRMATEFGIDRSFISDVERGKKSLSLPMLEVIALGMEISLAELLRDI